MQTERLLQTDMKLVYVTILQHKHREQYQVLSMLHYKLKHVSNLQNQANKMHMLQEVLSR